jgi:YVTN family beta-propeller protein
MSKVEKICLCFVVAACTALAAAANPPQFEVAKRFTLGGEGGWDYLKYDAAGHRLFITRGTHVMVVDAASGKVTGDIPNTPGVHGVALAPNGHGFTSNGGENTVTVFNLKDLKEVARVKVGDRPDAIMYEPTSKRVFTFNARSQDTTAVDTSNNTVAGTIPLGGKPEFAVADGRGHVFVNIEDKSELVEFSAGDLKELYRWPLAPCEEPSGLAIDTANRRLFSVCHNKLMAVVDADSGKVVATVPIGMGPDAARFDPALHLAFSSNGEGNLTVVREEGKDKYAVAQTVATERGARTMTLDPKTHTIYLVTAKFGPPPPATAEQPRPRPTMVPGSFELLVVTPKK